MTLNETRQLGVEFERRLQTLDPTFEVQRKLDTETIYAYLNEAQKQLFNKLYNLNISTPSSVEQSKYLTSVLGKFIDHTILNLNQSDESNRTNTYNLPSNFFAYIRSNSSVNSQYKGSTATNKRVQNVYLRHEDFIKYINEYFDQGVILRRPIAMLNADQDSASKLHVHYDIYTKVNAVELYYYRLPKEINFFIAYASGAFSEDNPEGCCELPYICFEELVETAIQIYLTYVKGQLEAEKKQKEKQNKKQEESED